MSKCLTMDNGEIALVDKQFVGNINLWIDVVLWVDWPWSRQCVHERPEKWTLETVGHESDGWSWIPQIEFPGSVPEWKKKVQNHRTDDDAKFVIIK